jgi:CelD/BcsL family acetyltransferase involved in cellulose biosynthesis
MVNTQAAADAPSASPGGALEIAVYQRWQDLEPLEPEWNPLLDRTRSPSIFLTWEWLRSWWEAFGASATPLVIAGRSGGRLAALAPLMLQRGRLGLRRVRFLADGTGDSDNLDVIALLGAEAEIVEHALAYLDAHRKYWDILELNTIPAESPTVAAVQAAAGRRGWRLYHTAVPHLSISLPKTWEEFLPRLSRKMREAVPARRRMLEKRYRPAVKCCTRAEELPQFLAELFRLHGLRWQVRRQTGAFTRSRQEFYRRMASRFLANGWLDLRVLELDGVPAAAQFGFRYGGVYSYLQSGFDPAYARCSPGWVLGEIILRDMIDAGMRDYDFLGGEDPYKVRWGAERRSYLYFTMVRPGSRGILMQASQRAAERVIAVVRSLTPRPIRSAARRMYRMIGKQPQD